MKTARLAWFEGQLDLDPERLIFIDVREALERVGVRLLYLPSYSPDFNPIEQLFAKLKALLRTAAARTIPALWETIRKAFTCFQPQECRNYIAASGYDAYDPT